MLTSFEMSMGSESVLLSILMSSGVASRLPETKPRRCPHSSLMVGRFLRRIAASRCELSAGWDVAALQGAGTNPLVGRGATSRLESSAGSRGMVLVEHAVHASTNKRW